MAKSTKKRVSLKAVPEAVAPDDTTKVAEESVAPITAEDLPQAAELVETNDYKMPDLLRQVTAATGMKRSDVKRVSEAVLHALSGALAEEKHVRLKPLGVVKVTRRKEAEPDSGKPDILVCKVRLPKKDTGETA